VAAGHTGRFWQRDLGRHVILRRAGLSSEARSARAGLASVAYLGFCARVGLASVAYLRFCARVGLASVAYLGFCARVGVASVAYLGFCREKVIKF